MRTNLIVAALAGLASIAATVRAAPSAAEIEAGTNLFTITCSSSFCHGEGGIGARGPSLRNRNFPPDFVRNTILNGRSGTPMPSFRDSLSAAEVEVIVKYVMSLSPNDHEQNSGTTAMAAISTPAPLSEQASRGADIFFDQTRSAACAFCHSYGGKGGLVGPDLFAVAAQTPAAIYQSIVSPASATVGFVGIAVTGKDGRRVVGIKHDQDDRQVGIFDLSSTPPVLRTFYIADGVTTEIATGPLYRHDVSGYSKNEIADLIAFLKSAGSGQEKAVTGLDLDLQ